LEGGKEKEGGKANLEKGEGWGKKALNSREKRGNLFYHPTFLPEEKRGGKKELEEEESR